MSDAHKPHISPLTLAEARSIVAEWTQSGPRGHYTKREADLARALTDLLEQLETLEQEWRSLLNEIDCRIEHGARTNGHLEYVRDRMKRASNPAKERQ